MVSFMSTYSVSKVQKWQEKYYVSGAIKSCDRVGLQQT